MTPNPGMGSNSDHCLRDRHDSPLNSGSSPGPAAGTAQGGPASSTYATPESGEAQRQYAGQEQSDNAVSPSVKHEPSS